MEEAGQVLEAHSVVAVPSTCKHLILIGKSYIVV
jgi:superfamily I DNA and/or RNA helicase